MHNPSRFFPLLSLLFAAACNEDQPATAPTSPAAENAASTAASHLIVNSLADPGNGVCNAQECTLREAIENAGSTTITFASGLSGTITL
ncbi:MAG: CSLREA domain-containing protein, partial [Gemmatimonadales bacterium]